jgi:hypothetical protein
VPLSLNEKEGDMFLGERITNEVKFGHIFHIVSEMKTLGKYKMRLMKCLKHIVSEGYEMPEAYNP